MYVYVTKYVFQENLRRYGDRAGGYLRTAVGDASDSATSYDTGREF